MPDPGPTPEKQYKDIGKFNLPNHWKFFENGYDIELVTDTYPIQEYRYHSKIVGNSKGNTIIGNVEDESLKGAKGDDTLKGAKGDDRLYGANGDDRLYGGKGHDELYGRIGDDFLMGGMGDDTLRGAKGDDILMGAKGTDELYGGNGDDILKGGKGTEDELYGGEGNDFLSSGPLRDDQEPTLKGGSGVDTFLLGEVDSGNANTTNTGGTNWANLGLSLAGDITDLVFTFLPGSKLTKEVVPMVFDVFKEKLSVNSSSNSTSPAESSKAKIKDFNPVEDVVIIPLQPQGSSNVFIDDATDGESDISFEYSENNSTDIFATLEFNIFGQEVTNPTVRENWKDSVINNALTIDSDSALLGLNSSQSLSIDSSDVEDLGTNKFLVLGAYSGREVQGNSNDDYLYGTNFGDVIYDHALSSPFLTPQPQARDDDQMRGFGGDDVFFPTAGEDTIKGGKGSDTVSYDQESVHADGFNAITITLSTEEELNFGNEENFADVEEISGEVVSIFQNEFKLDTGSENILVEAGSDGTSLPLTVGEDVTVTGEADDDDDVNLSAVHGIDVNLSNDGYEVTDDGFVDQDLLNNIENLNGDEELNGSQDNLDSIENIIGTIHDDTITGDDKNNTFTGLEGDDTLDGGDGQDTAVFSGNYEDYTITSDDNSVFNVQDDVGSDGTDNLENIEQFKFKDSTFDVKSEEVLKNIGEYGQVSINHKWEAIELDQSYSNPVVITSDPTYNGSDPATVRIKNVENNSFELRLQEPKSEDGKHPFDEDVSYVVIEEGDWDLADGTRLSAGNYNSGKLTSEGFETVDLTDFDNKPTVLSQVQTYNGGDWVTTRTKNQTASDFKLAMQEEEARNDGGHYEENIGWLAIEQSTVNDADDDIVLQGGTTGVQFDETENSFTFDDGGFSSDPALIAKLGSYNGGDSANVRLTEITESSFGALVREDTSLDSEVRHGNDEQISYLALNDDSGFLSAVV